MPQDVRDLAAFYHAPMGQLAQRVIMRRLRALWPDLRGRRLLGYGYAVPYLRGLADAERAIAAAGETFLFARVDGIVSATLGGFALTELEVVEPELFLRADPKAPERFAEAVARRLRV
jgi:hypothetical protein